MGLFAHRHVSNPAKADVLLARRRRLLMLSGDISHESCASLRSIGPSFAWLYRARQDRMSTIEMTYCGDSWVDGGAGRPSDTVSFGGEGTGDWSTADTGESGGEAAGGVRMNTREDDVARIRFAA